MKKAARWICPIVFLVLCAGVIWFLHLFTVTDEEMTYIDWQSAVQIAEDGTEMPYPLNDSVTNTPEQDGAFRFTTMLPEGLGDGYLLFETSGLELSMSFNGDEIYSSTAVLPEGMFGMSTANIPLPEGASGELTVTCTILDNTNTMFPPLFPSGNERGPIDILRQSVRDSGGDLGVGAASGGRTVFAEHPAQKGGVEPDPSIFLPLWA